jgi:hypothetical protein
MTKEEVCAKQWQETVRIARRDAASFPPEQYREWRYERLVMDPVRVSREMFAFAGLDWPVGLDAWLEETIHAKSLEKWRAGLTSEEVERIAPHLEPLMTELGYGDGHRTACESREAALG